MRPSKQYVISAAFYSFVTAILIGYPSAAVRSAPGGTPDFELWFVIAVLLGTALTAYSAIPKPKSLLQINWLTIPICCLLVFLVCVLINPAAVQRNATLVGVVCIFTGGMPLWLPILGLIVHRKSCKQLADVTINEPKPYVSSPSVKTEKIGRIRGFIKVLRMPSVKYSLLSLLVIGFFSGIIFWGGFNTVLEATNQLEFCIGCHEMRDTVYAEYKETIHYTNRTGVRAICSDCHVPKVWAYKMVRKIKASKEIFGKITGIIDTPQKFEKLRMELATNEWNRMKASDSRECRNCHSFESMASKKQRPKAQRNHAHARKEGMTCIDCHKGIAHLLPAEYEEPDNIIIK
jgi:cytochrome c-type protein NapC